MEGEAALQTQATKRQTRKNASNTQNEIQKENTYWKI